MLSSTSFQNAVILCATSNIQRNLSEDIVDDILEIALTSRRTYNHLNIAVCGLLSRDENWSINPIYIREINDYLSYQYDLNGVNFIKRNDWTLRNGFLKDSLYHFDNLRLIKDGNINLSKSIVSVIKPNRKATESVSIYSKLFNHTADFNFNDEYFPPLLCSMTVYDSVRSCKPVCTNNVCTSKPASNNHVRTSKTICTCTVHSGKSVYNIDVRIEKPVYASNVCSSELVCTSNIRTSRRVCDSYEHASKSVFTRNIRTSKPFFTSHVRGSRPVCTNHVHSNKSACASKVRLSKPVCTSNVRSDKPDTTSYVLYK